MMASGNSDAVFTASDRIKQLNDVDKVRYGEVLATMVS